jgi:hypothetical protein
LKQFFLRESVLAGKERPQLFVDHDGDLFIDRSVKRFEPGVGDDPQIESGNRRLASDGLRRVVIRLWAQVFVDIEGIDLILLIDPTSRVALAAEFPDLDGGNFERSSLGERCDGERREEAASRE